MHDVWGHGGPREGRDLAQVIVVHVDGDIVIVVVVAVVIARRSIYAS